MNTSTLNLNRKVDKIELTCQKLFDILHFFVTYF